jgi:hypothetical protein
VATYASRSAHADTLPNIGGSDEVAYEYSDPGEADSPANLATHNAIRRVQDMASRYASQVPFPAEANTSGTVIAGEHVGAMVEIDCARVSSGPNVWRRKP